MRPLLCLLIIISSCFLNNIKSQVSGCKDPAAINYNPSATVNDGSCLYNSSFYSPPVKIDPLSDTLIETSGLQMAGNFLWSFNDGGNAAAIYRVDTVSGAILQTVNLGGATNVDWEDIAFDGTYFYIGDFGNNADGARTDLKIYKFPFSAIASDYASNSNITLPPGEIEIISFSYSDQTPIVATTANNTRFDCEAMIVDGGQVHLFTKNWVDVNTTHYVINGISAGSYVATPLETLSTNYLVTAADKVPGSNIIALMGYQASGTGNHYMHMLSDFSGGYFFNGNKRRIDLPDAFTMGQAEGITFRDNSYGYISSEKFTRTIGSFTLTVAQKLRSFNLTTFMPAYALPLELKSFFVRPENGQNQINWAFEAPVRNLKIQYSKGAGFITQKEYDINSSGVYYHLPEANNACYRLAWISGEGVEHYSATACIKNEIRKGLSNVILRANGELLFNLAATRPQHYLFRLISTDGRLLAQTSNLLILPGSNRIDFGRPFSYGSILLLQALTDEGTNNMLLQTGR